MLHENKPFARRQPVFLPTAELNRRVKDVFASIPVGRGKFNLVVQKLKQDGFRVIQHTGGFDIVSPDGKSHSFSWPRKVE